MYQENATKCFHLFATEKKPFLCICSLNVKLPCSGRNHQLLICHASFYLFSVIHAALKSVISKTIQKFISWCTNWSNPVLSIKYSTVGIYNALFIWFHMKERWTFKLLTDFCGACWIPIMYIGHWLGPIDHSLYSILSRTYTTVHF